MVAGVENSNVVNVVVTVFCKDGYFIVLGVL